MKSLTVPFGISSLPRNLPDLDGEPFIVDRAAGPFIYSLQGTRYIDYALGMGADLLGHAHPAIVDACVEALRRGSLPAFRHEAEEEAAAALVKIGGVRISRATFTTTGTEAVHLACRLARHITGRAIVAKAVGGYDGWFDGILFGLVESPEAEAVLPRPVRNGVTLFRVNDYGDLEKLFEEHGRDLAAVVVEPLLSNTACLVPERSFFERLTELAHSNGTLIVSDEVMAGLKLGCKLVADEMGLAPDLVTMGKAIGSGIPVAALLGTPAAFEPFDSNQVPRYGTYHGNPLAAAAVLSTMRVLQRVDYSQLFQYGAKLRRSIVQIFREQGIAASTCGFDSVFSLWLAPEPPSTYESAKRALRPQASKRVFEVLRTHGVITLPSPWSRLFISFAHGDDELETTKRAYIGAARELSAARSDLERAK